MEALACVFALLPIGTQNLTKIGKYCDDQMCHIQMVDLHYCDIDCGSVKIPGSTLPSPDGSHGQPPATSRFDLTSPPRVTFPPGSGDLITHSNYTYCTITGYSYKYVKETSTWFQARDRCRREGAELVSIHSDEENEFVYNLVKSDHKALLNPYNAVWIGGRRRQGGRRYSFTWTDGSYFTYTNWAKFEPNDKNHKEDCVAMYHSRIDCKEEMKFLKHWNDLPCDTKLAFGYVCKKKFTKFVISPAKHKKKW